MLASRLRWEICSRGLPLGRFGRFRAPRSTQESREGADAKVRMELRQAYYDLKLRKPRTPAREGVGGAQRRRPGECNRLASTWMRDLPSRVPGLELRRRPGLMLRQPTARAPRNLHGDPLRSKMLQAPGSTQTAARPARARSSMSRAPPWPRPLHPHHTQVTPSTPRAPPQPRPPRPQLLPTRPGRPPYSTWAPPHTRPGLPGSGWRRGLSTLVLWTGLT